MKIINPNEYGSLLFDEKEEKAIIEVFKNNKIFRYADSNISKVDEFENDLKEFVNSKYCLGVINGTSALVTALVGCGVKEGDRVLVSSYTFLATALAPKLLGAIPIPLELDLDYGVNLIDLENELKKGCKAVIIVHLQGRCFNLNNVKKLIHKYNAVLIEDACQAFGAKNKGKYAGTIGDIGVYSFQQFKQISSGEGGAIVTNNKKNYNLMRNYSDVGSERNLFPNWNGPTVLFGQNYRMNNLTAAILCEQLKKLPYIIKKQNELRNKILNDINSDKIISSNDINGETGMNIIIKLKSNSEFDEIRNKAKLYGIEIRYMWSCVYFDNNLFKENKLTDIDLKRKSCDYTKNLVSKLAVISVPPILTSDECLIINKFIKENCI